MTSKLWAASVALGLGGIQLANAASVGAGCLNLAYPGTGGQPSYLDANVTFSSGTLPSGVYDAFCANINRAVGPQVYSFTAWEISAPEVASLGMVFDAANLDQVEFILNQAYPGQLSPDLTAFTSDDVQVAIWSLLDGPASLSLNRSALNFTQDRVDFILNEAGANGVGFVAGCG